ncbi:MAG: PSP1 domain-containing protein [Spirochaetota bacterium]
MSDQDIQPSENVTQNPEEYITAHQADPVLLVKFVNSNETQICTNPLNETFAKGDHVIVPSRYGKDLAYVLGTIKHIENYDMKDAEEVVRRASQHDIDAFERNIEKEAEALNICREKVKKHKLDMKLVAAHYLVDEPKILFFFTADARVDFRELVKDLVSVFKMRIELRQIGVRDESRVLGGLAVCGRKYCCNGITDKLNPVSIKMAKEQNLSLNSMKISGPCGRLLCCLAYEYDFYKEEKSRLPQEGNRIRIQNEDFKVAEVNILAKKIKLQSRDGRTIDIPEENFSWNESSRYWNVKIDDII